MLRRMSLVLLSLLFVLPSFAQEAANLTECVTEFDASTDYFPEKVELSYAEAFTVEYFNNYKVVTVVPFVGAEESQTYVLVQCGTPAPEGIEANAILEVPVSSIVTMSTTILPHLESQGLLDRLVGVDTLLYTNNESVLAMEELTEIGGGGSGTEINVEVLLELAPELIMGQQFYAGDEAFGPVREAGLNVVLNSDFADTSPLAAAEWGKYVALFFNTEAAANETFITVESEYLELQALAADVEERPSVIAASPYGDTWWMPAGDSTIAQLIADAGGDFLFADLEGTSVALSFEDVFEQGIDADFWVNVNQFWASTDDMLAADARYAEFAAFENGNLWNNNLRQNATGGIDYFESGFANPQLVLADLIAILHPELLPEHEFVYYQPLQ
jgi:iron complex transport system substrate-binding protein